MIKVRKQQQASEPSPEATNECPHCGSEIDEVCFLGDERIYGTAHAEDGYLNEVVTDSGDRDILDYSCPECEERLSYQEVEIILGLE